MMRQLTHTTRWRVNSLTLLEMMGQFTHTTRWCVNSLTPLNDASTHSYYLRWCVNWLTSLDDASTHSHHLWWCLNSFSLRAVKRKLTFHHYMMRQFTHTICDDASAHSSPLDDASAYSHYFWWCVNSLSTRAKVRPFLRHLHASYGRSYNNNNNNNGYSDRLTSTGPKRLHIL